MTPARLLALFAFYAAALDLGWGRGFVDALASPPGLALVLGAAVLLAWRTALSVRGAAPLARRAARLLVGGGGALALLALPASLVTRDARTVTVGEGQALAAGWLPGLPETRVGAIALAPEGPHVLSKTVAAELRAGDEAPVRVGLFPPVAVGPWRLSVVRFGYAAGVTWLGERGEELVRGWVMMGTLQHAEEDAALVTWTPEPNVMMGAGTFPPRLEELVSPGGADRPHLFVRLDEAVIRGTRRDLRDPDAYRWLVDGRLEDARFFAQVLRGGATVYEGDVRAGEAVRFAGGALSLERDVRLWVDLVAVRDPFLPVAAAGLLLLALGLLLAGGLAVARRAGGGARR